MHVYVCLHHPLSSYVSFTCVFEVQNWGCSITMYRCFRVAIIDVGFAVLDLFRFEVNVGLGSNTPYDVRVSLGAVSVFQDPCQLSAGQ